MCHKEIMQTARAGQTGFQRRLQHGGGLQQTPRMIERDSLQKRLGRQASPAPEQGGEMGFTQAHMRRHCGQIGLALPPMR